MFFPCESYGMGLDLNIYVIHMGFWSNIVSRISFPLMGSFFFLLFLFSFCEERRCHWVANWDQGKFSHFVFVFGFLIFLNLTLYVNWVCNWKWPISDLLVLECWVSGEFEKLTKWKYVRVLSTKVPLCWFVMAYVKVSHLSDIDILPLRPCKSTRYEKEDAYIGYIKDNYWNMWEWRIR